MEIIEELEPERRGIYAGAVGYFGADGAMDTAIALRTAVVADGKMYVQAGGGIVADSDPEAEFQESCNKARALIRAAEAALRFAQGNEPGRSVSALGATHLSHVSSRPHPRVQRPRPERLPAVRGRRPAGRLGEARLRRPPWRPSRRSSGLSEAGLSLAPSLSDFESRSAALAPVVRRLAEDGLITGWRDELYPACPAFDRPALFAVERAAAARFGLRSFGVHLMGYLGPRRGDGALGGAAQRRQGDRTGHEGRLRRRRHGPRHRALAVMVKEAWEEAGLPAALAERAKAAGEVRFAFQSDQGIDFGLDYQYELELPGRLRAGQPGRRGAGFLSLAGT